MRKKVICFVLCAMLFALCLPSPAQQPKRLPRIGYLWKLGVGEGESNRDEFINCRL